MEPVEQGYFRASDGTRLFYSAEGPKHAPPLVFCYGLVCTKLQWKYQMEALKKTHRVLLMDYRGHGQSDRPESPNVTIERCAMDLLEFLDDQEFSEATFLGHSLGVNIVLELYRISPKRVTALVLANGTPKDPFETMFHHNFLQVAFPAIRWTQKHFPELLQKTWRTQGTNLLNREFVARVGFNPKYAKRADIFEYLRLTSSVDLDIFLHLLEDFMKTDCTHWLHEIKAPTLVIAGEQDKITPPINQRIFQQLVPHCQYHLIPEGSHCPQMEKPELVNTILWNFLKQQEEKKKKRTTREQHPPKRPGPKD